MEGHVLYNGAAVFGGCDSTRDKDRKIARLEQLLGKKKWK